MTADGEKPRAGAGLAAAVVRLPWVDVAANQRQGTTTAGWCEPRSCQGRACHANASKPTCSISAPNHDQRCFLERECQAAPNGLPRPVGMPEWPSGGGVLLPKCRAMRHCGQRAGGTMTFCDQATESMDHIRLGQSELLVHPICLGTMTFGEQVDETGTHTILDHAMGRGLNFWDTAEMYSVPARRETFGATETLIGRWFAKHPGARQRVVLATKVAGPSRNMEWVRNGADNLRPEDIVQACEDSLKRLQTDVIDLYQIHWPNRNAPAFGALYFDPSKDRGFSSIQAQLEAMAMLVKAGKVRHVGLSNETPWGLSEFLRVAEQHDLPRVVSVQNPYALVNRSVDNGLDEVMHRSGVSLLAYSPLGFGALTGKYDGPGFDPEQPELGRLAKFATMRSQRWARPDTLAAARLYNSLARAHGLTPAQLALAFCYRNWRVASTIIGVTSVAQLDENLAAWNVQLGPELLAAIDAIRWQHRDPAQ